ncbi:Brain protein 44 [Apostichopus japonicus]|uniref:Mitochondrial pyruvate carrier n=1 Tax=Stichopus japonicus TaxID=307972 RepID=A0A2G8JLH1_STIJA|nr:Brain protein 44 [Apostichopus japonicus]
MAGSQRFGVILRRVLYGQRGYSTQPVEGATLWARLDASVEKAIPEKFRPLWNHPAGMKTIFFWAPTFKWCLVIAGIADYTRPAEKLSWRQSGALCTTGVIWSRYSLVIVPKNWNLFSVNFFLALTGGFQLLRIYLYQKNLQKEDPEKYEQLYGRRGPRRADGETPCPAERRHGGRRQIGEKVELETSAVVTASEATATAAEEVKT